MRRTLSFFSLLLLVLFPLGEQAYASDIIFDFGSPVVVDASYTSDSAIATLDATHVIVTTAGGVRVGTLTGSTVAFGTQTVLANYTSSVAIIDATHAVIGYVDTDGNVSALIATISGTDVTLGDPALLSMNGMSHFKSVAVAALDSTHVAVVYHESFSTAAAYALIGEVSGDSISFGSPVGLGDAFYVDITTLDSSHIVVSYEDFDDGGQFVVVGEVTGTDVSFGTAVTAGYPCVDSSIEALDATHVLFAYCNVNDGNDIKLLVGEVSGTDISLGTQFSVGAQGEYFSLAKLDGTHAVFGMQNISLGLIPVAYRLTIDGSDIDISPVITVMDVNPDHTAVAALDDSTIVYTLTSSAAYAFVGTERTRPDPVTGVSAAVDDSDITLSWTNPVDPDFASVSIRRSTVDYPETVDDGTVVADGLTTTSYTDDDLSDGFYFYSIFVLDTNDNPSDATTVAMAIDSAPAAATNVCSLRTYWALDTFESSTAPDTSGNGFNAVDLAGGGTPDLSTSVPTNGPTTDSHSYLFTAADSDYLRASLPVTNDFTLCAWVKTTTAGSGDDHWESRAILHAEAGGVADDFGFGMNANNELIFGNGDGSNDYSVAGSTAINTGEWVHACVTRQKSSGQIRLFVNGDLEGAGIGSTTSLSDSTYIYVGGANDGGQNWNGYIDDIRIYDSVLNAADIRSIAGRTASCLSASSSSSSSAPQSNGGGRGQSRTPFRSVAQSNTSPTTSNAQPTTPHTPQSLSPSAPTTPVSPSAPATVPAQAIHLLNTVQTRLQERVQRQIVANPKLAPILKKMLTRMNARIAKLAKH